MVDFDSPKTTVGKRLQAFRKSAGITQRDFADFMNTGKAYVWELENGSANPSLEMLIRYSHFYGVQFYELANPAFPIPNFEQLPAATRKAINALKKQQEKNKEKAEQRKATSKAEGVPGRAKQLHELLATGFFNRPKTAKDAFVKLNPGVPKAGLGDHLTEIGKITTTLGQGKFLRLLDKLEPEPGSIAVRFVAKTAGVVAYLDGPAGSKDLAAVRSDNGKRAACRKPTSSR